MCNQPKKIDTIDQTDLPVGIYRWNIHQIFPKVSFVGGPAGKRLQDQEEDPRNENLRFVEGRRNHMKK
jgi:hypothetical protein